jgi:hypothetical protein
LRLASAATRSNLVAGSEKRIILAGTTKKALSGDPHQTDQTRPDRQGTKKWPPSAESVKFGFPS